VVWQVADSSLAWLKEDKAEWTGTKMVFELSTDDDNRTVVAFTHLGLGPQCECFDRVAEGWNTVICVWLPDYVKTGIGLHS
jgi:hypothetical protein